MPLPILNFLLSIEYFDPKISSSKNYYMKQITKYFFLSMVICSSSLLAASQDINGLILKARQKIDKVNDYEAAARMKTNVTFLKVPIATVKVYFKKPNLLKVKSEKGISFIPKGAVSINMNSILGSTDYRD